MFGKTRGVEQGSEKKWRSREDVVRAGASAARETAASFTRYGGQSTDPELMELIKVAVAEYVGDAVQDKYFSSEKAAFNAILAASTAPRE